MTKISQLSYPTKRSIVASAILLDRLMNHFKVSHNSQFVKDLGRDVREKIDESLLQEHCQHLDNFFSDVPDTDIKLIRIR